MSTRNLLNLLLLVLAAALVTFIALRPGQHVDTPKLLTHIDPQAITRIELTRHAAGPLQFSKTGTHWQIDGTPVMAADDFQLHTVLALLDAGVVRSYPVAGLDLAGLGLDPPQAHVVFDQHAFDVGNTDAIEGLRYVRNGDTVALVSDKFAHLLNAGASNFVQRQLLPDGAQITRLELPGLTLDRSDDAHWQLQPEAAGTSADDIQALLRNWQSASALYLSQATDQDSTETVRITLQGQQQPVEFRIISRTPDLVMVRPDWGMQYHLGAEQIPQLLALPEHTAPR
jgi:hypothetical protein